MGKNFEDLLEGYQVFREKYAAGDKSIMKQLSDSGQSPQIMVVACSDSRVDPALILQCDPGDLFVVRNVANIIPPFENDNAYHGTSAALEFGIRFLKVKHLIILGHSQCGGIQALLNQKKESSTDFIENWVSIVKNNQSINDNLDSAVKKSIQKSYDNCLSFPWLKERIEEENLKVHLWFFEIKSGKIYSFLKGKGEFEPLKSRDDITF